MKTIDSWAERIADQEGGYLSPDDLQNLIRYSLSFQERLELYQLFQQQEANWIEKVVQPLDCREAEDLSPTQILLARRLAWCLRSVALSLLLGDPLPLQQVIWGAMEEYLGLGEALERLWQILQGSLLPEQQEWVAPYWQSLRSACSAPVGGAESDCAPLAQAAVAPADLASEPAPTLMEMFV